MYSEDCRGVCLVYWGYCRGGYAAVHLQGFRRGGPSYIGFVAAHFVCRDSGLWGIVGVATVPLRVFLIFFSEVK